MELGEEEEAESGVSGEMKSCLRKTNITSAAARLRAKSVGFDIHDKTVPEVEKEPVETIYQSFVDKWKDSRDNYLKTDKLGEDESVRAIAESTGSTTLMSSSFRMLFNNFRELRELVLRLHSFNAKHFIRVLLSEGSFEHALQLLKMIELDALLLESVDHEDEAITGISDETRESLLKLIDEDIFEDNLPTWISYIMFFSNPFSQWVRMRKLFFDIYFSIVDTAILYLMLNNNLSEVKTLITRKPPDCFKPSTEYDAPVLQRVDQRFSRFKHKPCETSCKGHVGKLMLVLIRLFRHEIVELMIKHGIQPNVQCCSGRIKKLYWLASKKQDLDSDDDDLFIEQDKVMAKEFKSRSSDGLQAVYELVTPLSVAVECSNAAAVKMLLRRGVSTLTCNDIAIRSCVKSVSASKSLNKKKRQVGSVHEFLTKEVVSIVDDQEFIFQLILEAAEKELNKKKIYVANYCRIALLYQSVINQDWDAEKVLTALKSEKDNVSKTLNRYNIGAGSVFTSSNQMLRGFSLVQVVSSAGSRRNRGNAGSVAPSKASAFKSAVVHMDLIEKRREGSMIKSDDESSQGSIKPQRLRRRFTSGASRVNSSFGSIRSSLRGTFNKVSTRIKTKRFKSIKKKKSVFFHSDCGVDPEPEEELEAKDPEAQTEEASISEPDPIEEEHGGNTEYLEVNGEMREDLCFALVSVIDKLLDDMLSAKATAYGRYLYGILFLIERHELYLDEPRFERLLESAVTVLVSMSAGDGVVVAKLLQNRQFRNFLGVDRDKYWRRREIRLFIKSPNVRDLLKLKSRNMLGSRIVPSSRNKAMLLLSSPKTQSFNKFMELLAKNNFSDGIVNFLNSTLPLMDETPGNMMREACLCESLESIDVIAKHLNKELLADGLRVSLENQKALSCQKILAVDSELSEEQFTLIESYVSGPLFLSKPLDLDNRHFTDEEEELDSVAFEGTINFFLTCMEGDPKLKGIIGKILLHCFGSTRFINMRALMLFLEVSLETFPDLVTEDLVVSFIASKENQFDAVSAMVESEELKREKNDESRYGKTTGMKSNVGQSLSKVVRRPKKKANKLLGSQKIKNWKKRQQQREEKRDLRHGRWLKGVEKLHELAIDGDNPVSVETTDRVGELMELMPARFKPAASEHSEDYEINFEGDDMWSYAEEEEDEWGNTPLF